MATNTTYGRDDLHLRDRSCRRPGPRRRRYPLARSVSEDYLSVMTIRINRVYTRSGDGGTSRLAGGQEITKDSPRLHAYGTIDELNAVMGLVAEHVDEGSPLCAPILRIQNVLFDLGGELATLPEDRHPSQPLVCEQDTVTLETEMDEMNATLPALTSFILPGGGRASAYLHLARTVCRRAERRLVTLSKASEVRRECIQFVNRLGDWFFVAGRQAAADAGEAETLWRPGHRGE